MNNSLAGARRTTQPKAEAKDLFNMVIEGNCSITYIRKLIAVPPPIEGVLRACSPEGILKMGRGLSAS